MQNCIRGFPLHTKCYPGPDSGPLWNKINAKTARLLDFPFNVKPKAPAHRRDDSVMGGINVGGQSPFMKRMTPIYKTHAIFKMFFQTWDRQEIVGFLVWRTVCLFLVGNAYRKGPSRERLTGWNTRSPVRPPLEKHRRVVAYLASVKCVKRNGSVGLRPIVSEIWKT